MKIENKKKKTYRIELDNSVNKIQSHYRVQSSFFIVEGGTLTP